MTLSRLLAPLAALLLAALPARAADVTTFALDNGMEVVVLEDHRAPVAVHMVWYKVGSADEPRGTSGIAHYLEHLMFKATDSLEAGELSSTVAALGGSDNAFTSYDYTAYFQRVAAEHLERMMEMEADRMANLALVEDDIATERQVVIEERNQRTENDPGALFAEQRQAAQYLHHPYGVPVIGWRHEMVEMSLADAEAFYDAHYGPNNAVLVVAGDVDPEAVREMAERHYGAIPANPDIVERARVDEPPQTAERRLVYEDPRVGQPYVIRTYLAPERNAGAQEEAAALTMLANILGGSNTTSVLAEKLQFDSQQAIYTSAFYDGASLDETTFGLVVVPAPGVSLEDAEAALDEAVASFREEGVDPARLERIKRQVAASLIYAEDDAAALARRYGQGLTQGLTVADIEAWPDVLRDVTAEDILAAADRLFARDRAVTGYLTAPEDAPTPAALPTTPADDTASQEMIQ